MVLTAVCCGAKTSYACWHRYPHVFTLCCAAHAVDLFLKDVCKLEFFSEVIARAKAIIQHFTTIHALTAIFTSKSNLRLLKPGAA